MMPMRKEIIATTIIAVVATKLCFSIMLLFLKTTNYANVTFLIVDSLVSWA